MLILNGESLRVRVQEVVCVSDFLFIMDTAGSLLAESQMLGYAGPPWTLGEIGKSATFLHWRNSLVSTLREPVFFLPHEHARGVG